MELNEILKELLLDTSKLKVLLQAHLTIRDEITWESTSDGPMIIGWLRDFFQVTNCNFAQLVNQILFLRHTER